MKLPELSDLFDIQVIKKVRYIISDASHPLYDSFQTLPSGSLYRVPLAKTNRFKFSFVPYAIKVLNLNRKR